MEATVLTCAIEQPVKFDDGLPTKKSKIEPDYSYDIPFKMMTPSSQLRDLDLVRWLDNKLGDNSEAWGGRQAASLLSREMLVELQTCFQALEPHVKLKIVLAYPHLSNRLINMWKDPLVSLLDLARRDADDWVETVADMYRNYPERQCILPVPENPASYFRKSLEELRKVVKKTPFDENLRLLPIDTFAMSTSAIKVHYGLEELESSKHFTLKQRAKSSILKADVIKSSEASLVRSKNQKLEVICTSFPIRMRSTARKPNNDLPMRGIPKTNTCKLSAGFTNEPRKYQRRVVKREGGAKLIDIGELPQALKLRRKEQEEEEKARKKLEKEEQRKRLQAEKAERKAQELAAALAAAAAEPINLNITPPEQGKNCSPTTSSKEEKSSTPTTSPNTSQQGKDLNSYANVREVPTVQTETTTELQPQQLQQSQQPQQQNISAATSAAVAAASAAAAKEARREALVRRQCEEMLGNANALNEEGHRMVTVFMSGNKVHPYPHLGDIVTLKLSESLENDILPDGTSQKVRVETFFQMDYRTGEWKRLRKTRVLRPEEFSTVQQSMIPQQFQQTATIS